jgi:hypothetical protein
VRGLQFLLRQRLTHGRSLKRHSGGQAEALEWRSSKLLAYVRISLMDEWDRQLREVHAGQREHLKTWNQLTYDLGAMARDEHGRLRLDCKLGTHYH